MSDRIIIGVSHCMIDRCDRPVCTAYLSDSRVAVGLCSIHQPPDSWWEEDHEAVEESRILADEEERSMHA